MIAESYDLVTDSPSKRIYEAVKQIPKGKVASYGQVAAMAGRSENVHVLSAMHCIKIPDPENIPCYRVVNAKGELIRCFCIRWSRRAGETSRCGRNPGYQWKSRSGKVRIL